MASTTLDYACAVCGNGDDCKKCSRCQLKAYCSVKCQKKDWKNHKTICFAPHAVCTRCEDPIRPNGGTSITKCRVPHPEHLLQDRGSSYGREGMQLGLHCMACQNSFSKRKPARGIPGSTTATEQEEWTYNPPSAQWCYWGSHTVKPMSTTDARRVQKDVVSLQADSNVQAKIDALKEDTRILTIKSSSGMFDDSITPTLNKRLPKLQELHLLDVCFASVNLDSHTAPNLERLEMQNIPDECAIQVSCKLLKEFEMRYYHGDTTEWLDTTLSVATDLEIFKSYKLGVEEIQFASNSLREVHLHRSDILSEVSLWAPRLQLLRLQGCYSLEELHILEDHPLLSQGLPSGFRPSRFSADTTNSCLSLQVKQALNSNPRVDWEGDAIDESAGVGGGMEAMFRMMHSSRGM